MTAESVSDCLPSGTLCERLMSAPELATLSPIVRVSFCTRTVAVTVMSLPKTLAVPSMVTVPAAS